MARTPRFDCASSSLTLKALLRKAERVLWICFGLGCAIHFSLMQISGFETEDKVIKPLTTQFIKRQPRLSKPLELKKRPQPKRRQMQRKIVSVKAKMQRDQRATHFQPMQALRGLARPSVEIGRTAAFGSVEVEPRSIAEIIQGTKEVEQKIDMSLELLDIQALDTGQYDAMVVQDPTDKRNVQGFCHLAAIYIPHLQDEVLSYASDAFDHYVVASLRRLVAAMNEYTGIRTDLKGRMVLGDREMVKTPWVFFLSSTFTGGAPLVLSDQELESMGEYLMSGGFLFADDIARKALREGGKLHQRDLVLKSLKSQGVRGAVERLPNSHPIYHCYFDFEGPPPAADASNVWHMHRGYGPAYLFDHLDGVVVGGRLVAILSDKGYYQPWAVWRPTSSHEFLSTQDPTLQFQFGVNVIIFSLTQEGSITHRLMDAVAY